MFKYLFLYLSCSGTLAYAQLDTAHANWVKNIPPELNRFQIPHAPFNYTSEDLTFKSAETGLTYGATLTKPRGYKMFPTVVLIDGTGPQDRDYTAYFHKYFWVLADYLSNNGIAVLRLDDRGVGGTNGNFEQSTSRDFSKDIHSAVTYLYTRKDIDHLKIGLIGHSEGGIIAPMVYTADSAKICFMVLLSPPVIGLRAINRFQNLEQLARGGGADSLIKAQEVLHDAIVSHIPNDAHNMDELTVVLKKELAAFCKTQSPQMLDKLMIHDNSSMRFSLTMGYQGFLSPWWQYILTYDPINDLKTIKCPVLAIYGTKDVQVPPEEDYGLIKASLPKNSKTKIVLFKDVNHFMQAEPDGTSRDYTYNPVTIAPEVLSQIATWINALLPAK